MPSQGAESDLSFIVEQSLSMSRVDRRLTFHNRASNSRIRLDANAIIDG
jgi:hypothetical protein